MADENNVEPMAVIAGKDPEAKATTDKKQRSPRRQKMPVQPVRAAPNAAAPPQTSRAKNYSAEERVAKLASINDQVNKGVSTLKAAVKAAGISEQTYYNWKRTANPGEQSDPRPAPAGDELVDLVQLEQENLRLRKTLAEKLRAENADLRKRLGLS
ncbi:transposase [Rhizobium tubonense]|uniref:Transcriptional regulator n=1 Tax=Rhizobium tubonense TaxID=484088 RepID=A0A2W4EQ05_9HYPH|nr:transposase [Rhizobium tubonense]PZM15576.1 transcriptional regulator [Rhizobium tubonense]